MALYGSFSPIFSTFICLSRHVAGFCKKKTCQKIYLQNVLLYRRAKFQVFMLFYTYISHPTAQSAMIIRSIFESVLLYNLQLVTQPFVIFLAIIHYIEVYLVVHYTKYNAVYLLFCLATKSIF